MNYVESHHFSPQQSMFAYCQPSSSLRAAELLEASGAAGGFSFGFPFTVIESEKLGSEDSAELSDADFSLVIKRMAKKDCTTKLKAS